jgi:hypothetical protein
MLITIRKIISRIVINCQPLFFTMLSNDKKANNVGQFSPFWRSEKMVFYLILHTN